MLIRKMIYQYLIFGCGGGKSISLFFSMLKKSKIYDIDHSSDMVNLSRKINSAGITEGTVDIVQG
jgi:trans-aconitate methyltransferase